jgi:hypothetical protein
LHDSSDARDPQSLWSELSRRLQAERLPVRDRGRARLVSLAAVADGVVRVRAGARLSARRARRIALHEVEGHVRPRVHGQRSAACSSPAPRARSEDEEGRAILLEERAGLLDAERRESWRGATWRPRACAAAPSFGTPCAAGHAARRSARPSSSLPRASRRWLGRELIYLVGLSARRAALRASPELERVLTAAASRSSAAEACWQAQSSSTMTGMWSDGLSSWRGFSSMRQLLQRAASAGDKNA